MKNWRLAVFERLLSPPPRDMCPDMGGICRHISMHAFKGQRSMLSIFLETGCLTEPGPHWFNQTGWLVPTCLHLPVLAETTSMCRHTQLFMGVWVIQTQALMLVWQTLAELPLQPHRNNTLLPSNTLSPTVHTAALNSGSQLRRQKRARETAQEVKELLWKPGNLNWIPGTHVKSQRPWHTPEIPEFLQRDGRQRRGVGWKLTDQQARSTKHAGKNNRRDSPQNKVEGQNWLQKSVLLPTNMCRGKYKPSCTCACRHTHSHTLNFFK